MIIKCRRCGGQVLIRFEDASCLQCGATYTSEGKLLTDYARESNLKLVSSSSNND